MKLYEIRLNDGIVDWAGTQADAKAAAKAAGGTWAEQEVPTDKPSLIAWLKLNAVDHKGE